MNKNIKNEIKFLGIIGLERILEWRGGFFFILIRKKKDNFEVGNR